MLKYPLDLFSRNESPERILKRAAESGSNKQLAAAHYYVAMHYVHEGKRQLAIDHFGQCCKIDFFMDNIPLFVQGFLERMQSDDYWPMYRTASGAERMIAKPRVGE